MWERLIRNVWDPLRGPCRQEDLVRLQASQWDTPATIRERQLVQLQSLMRHAVENVPYYRERSQATDDFASIPVLTKNDVRHSFEQLQATNITSKVHRKRTSGSTGSPLEIVVDAEALAFKHAIARRANEWSGWRIGQPMAQLWGVPDYHRQGFKGRCRNRLIDRAIHLNTLDLTTSRMDDFLRKWNRHAPVLLFGHAHSLYLLAIHAKQRKFGVRPARSIISSAMPLHGFQRKLIEEVFGYRITDRYGCEETSLIACECERGGMHIASESVYVEVIEGKLIITDLVNRAMPLIRYEIGDCAELSDAVCACGRGLPIIKSLAGREADFVVTPDGRWLSGISLTENLILKLANVQQLQIVQEAIEHIRLRIVSDIDTHRFSIRQSAIEVSRSLFGPAMRIELEFVVKIQPEASGKYRFCISEVSKDFARSIAA